MAIIATSPKHKHIQYTHKKKDGLPEIREDLSELMSANIEIALVGSMSKIAPIMPAK
jgi:hypothetical protein